MWYLRLLIISSFALRLCTSQARQPTHLEQNVWESFAPGELLRLLEHSTYLTPATAQRRSDTAPTTSLLTAEPETSAYSTPSSTLTRTDTPTDNTYDYPAEDQLNAPSSDEFNYDRAYEAFVRQYFTDKLAEENDDSIEKNDDEALDGAQSDEEQLETEHSSSAETEPLTEETKNRAQRKKKDKCRRVKKHKQNCMICENARTGEKSESCSFSRESEPHRYAFEKETSYKKQRDAEEPSSQSLEQTSSEEAEAAESSKTTEETNKRSIKNRRAQDKPPTDSSTCIQMVRRGKVCYRCVSGDGTTTKCYTPRNAKAGRDNRKRAAKGNEHKVQKSQQRIYKRTISYSYEKGTNGTNANGSNETEQLKNGTIAIGSPQLKKKIFIKVVKENETIAE